MTINHVASPKPRMTAYWAVVSIKMQSINVVTANSWKWGLPDK